MSAIFFWLRLPSGSLWTILWGTIKGVIWIARWGLGLRLMRTAGDAGFDSWPPPTSSTPHGNRLGRLLYRANRRSLDGAYKNAMRGRVKGITVDGLASRRPNPPFLFRKYSARRTCQTIFPGPCGFLTSAAEAHSRRRPRHFYSSHTIPQ